MSTIILVLVLAALALFILKVFINRSPKHYEKLLRNMLLFCLISVVVLFSLTAVTPYMLNMRDYARIEADRANIKLYNKYIDEYSAAARKQIAEFKKLEEEMVKMATPTQLQYWSKQTDQISKELTNRIKELKDKILELELDINTLKAKIEQRYRNRFYILKK